MEGYSRASAYMWEVVWPSLTLCFDGQFLIAYIILTEIVESPLTVTSIKIISNHLYQNPYCSVCNLSWTDARNIAAIVVSVNRLWDATTIKELDQ